MAAMPDIAQMRLDSLKQFFRQRRVYCSVSYSPFAEGGGVTCSGIVCRLVFDAEDLRHFFFARNMASTGTGKEAPWNLPVQVCAVAWLLQEGESNGDGALMTTSRSLRCAFQILQKLKVEDPAGLRKVLCVADDVA